MRLDEARTLTGHVVTAYEPEDHPWHRGIGLAIPHVAGYNFWGGPTFVDGQGYVVKDDHGTITPDGAWLASDGRHLLTETREVTHHVASSTTWELRWSFALTNVTTEPMALGSPATEGRPGAGYGGLFWRGADDFRGGRVSTPDSDGESRVNGRPAPWLKFRGPRAELTFWADESVEEPWFVRSAEYPGVCPALAFHHRLVLDPGQAISRNYRIEITDSGDE